jgi:hypothetical protein
MKGEMPGTMLTISTRHLITLFGSWMVDNAIKKENEA